VVLRECRAALLARGTTVVGEATGGSAPGDIAAWAHYPPNEVYDPLTHLQYFFHRHAAALPAATARECGHFHLFLRGEGMPPGAVPLLLAETAVANVRSVPQSAPLKRGSSDKVCHLVAIAVDEHGEPIRLFTTNRWVTGETWYRADDVVAMLGKVRFDGVSRGPTLLDRWIGGVVRLFWSEIEDLLRRRDAAIVEWRWRWPRGNAFEDPRLEVTSSQDIDLAARLAAIEAGRASSRRLAPLPPRRASLPSMADGWGS